MNILINCSNLVIGGGLQVAHSIISQLNHYKQHYFVVVCSSELSEQLVHNTFNKNIELIRYNTKAKAVKTITGNDHYLNKVVRDNKIEVVFSVFGPTYWKPKVKHITGYAKSQYIYTDSPFFKTLSFRSKLKLEIKKFFHLYDFKHNNQVLISENDDVSSRLKKKFKGKEIHTITNYYNQLFDQNQKWDNSLQLPCFEGFSILTVSANYPHKNLKIIPRVIDYLNKKYPAFKYRFVVTVTKGELENNLDQSINNKLVYLGKIHINQCPSLYSQSDAVFLPTLLECFTASYPEAMRMQKPILTSNLNFAKALCEDSAKYFDPLNPEDIGEKIYELANNSELIDNLIFNGKHQLKKYDSYVNRIDKYLKLITK